MNYKAPLINIEYAVLYSDMSTMPERTAQNVLNYLNKQVIEKNIKHFYCVVPILLEQPWLNNSVSLVIIYSLVRQNNQLSIDSFIVKELAQSLFIKDLHSSKNLVSFECGEETFKNTITVNFDSNLFVDIKNNIKNDFIFKLNEPFVFEPVSIQKPWGQEIWFTGVEKRGVSCIRPFTNRNGSLPLPWVFSAMPQTLQGTKFAGKNLTLVKILDPLPDEVFGDLYFELHVEKNEVYVVTEISAASGRIKLGANPEKLKMHKETKEYKELFLNSVKKYEAIRRDIDAIYDEYRKEEGIELNLPISAEKIKSWQEKIPKNMLDLEKKLRQEMDSYVGYLNLNIGDVVCVPTYLPHALQHGVKVIEFQTPTYERKIISFGQKVLTQSTWDTVEAISIMNVLPPERSRLLIFEENEHYLEEIVCTFNEFDSMRVTVNKDCEYNFSKSVDYKILFLLKGNFTLINENSEEFSCDVGQCLYLPASKNFSVQSCKDSVFLICYPK
ncbi:hypothetical protein [Fluviispira sanaruensis]|uniref:Mannose-6-phosphate isomerase n=1 Tax=Fluviispira sanaruensis TaxID=2493639 RepID=A0A4P2VN61_FLUSA|nr:hypothetical protein [Fluviispira sanaruensis]BBH52989.1 hypothetical protein JCM31447_14320 [Fluviispira sanaruensis]